MYVKSLAHTLLCSVWLLSYDKDIVARALTDAHNCNGEEYLEKIIQIPFDVPPVDSYKIQEILSNKIREISVDLDDTSNIYYEYQSIVFHSCVYPFVKTLRDINRYCNVLNFQYAAVKEEVNFIDMAAITALQVFAPAIHEWIRDNKFTLVGGYDGQGISRNNIFQQKADRIEEFKTVYPNDPEGMLEGSNPKFCVTAKSGANRVKFIMGGRRVKRLPPC